MNSNFNVFEVLNIKSAEDPHDRMVAWLCDPAGGHGIPDVAYAIIERLWGEECNEAVREVVRQFKLAEESWPDVGVVFTSALLLIENKVQASALREGQLELQHSLGRQRQGGKRFFHCVLCPDFLQTPSRLLRQASGSSDTACLPISSNPACPRALQKPGRFLSSTYPLSGNPSGRLTGLE